MPIVKTTSMKRIATKTITIRIKVDDNRWRIIELVKGKVVATSKLKELSSGQIRKYTEEEDKMETLSFLSAEDKRFYKKNKDHPDMAWALDILHG